MGCSEVKNEVLRSIVMSGSVTTEDGKTRTLHSLSSRKKEVFFSKQLRVYDRKLVLRSVTPTDFKLYIL